MTALFAGEAELAEQYPEPVELEQLCPPDCGGDCETCGDFEVSTDDLERLAQLVPASEPLLRMWAEAEAEPAADLDEVV